MLAHPRPEAVQRLKRVFNTDIEICQACGEAIRTIALSKYPVVVETILTHFDAKGGAAGLGPLWWSAPVGRVHRGAGDCPDRGGGLQVEKASRGKSTADR